MSPYKALPRGQFLKIWRAHGRSQEFILSAIGAAEGRDLNNLYSKEISLASSWGIKYKGTKMEEGRLVRRQLYFPALLLHLFYQHPLTQQPLAFSLFLQQAKSLPSLRLPAVWNACPDFSTTGPVSFGSHPLRGLSRPGGSNYNCSQICHLSLGAQSRIALLCPLVISYGHVTCFGQ